MGFIPLHTRTAGHRLSRSPAGGQDVTSLRTLNFRTTTPTPTKLGGTKTPKLLTIALPLGAIAMTGVATQAEAQFKPCIKINAKDNLPCPMTADRTEQVKFGSR